MTNSSLRGGRKSNGIRVLFEKEVAEKLNKLAKDSPDMLNRVLAGLSYSAKQEVQKGFRANFGRRTGKFEKRMKYQKIRNGFYRLKAPNLAAIYEYKGAHITPVNGSVLKFTADNGEVIFSKYIDITPRPFFYSSLRRFVNSGQMNEVMKNEIKKTIRSKKL